MLVARTRVRIGQSFQAVPRPLTAGFAAGVPDLDCRHRAMRAHDIGDTRQRRNVRIRPDAEIAVCDAALLCHRRHLGEHDAGSAERELAEMDHVPVARHPAVGAVGAHRR